MSAEVMSIEIGAPRCPFEAVEVAEVALKPVGAEGDAELGGNSEPEANGASPFNCSYLFPGFRDAMCTTFLGFRPSSRAIYEPGRAEDACREELRQKLVGEDLPPSKYSIPRNPVPQTTILRVFMLSTRQSGRAG